MKKSRYSFGCKHLVITMSKNILVYVFYLFVVGCGGEGQEEETIRTFTCPPKPQGDATVYNTVSSYTQQKYEDHWSPADDTDTEFNMEPTESGCRYRCAPGYLWKNSSCIAVTWSGVAVEDNSMSSSIIYAIEGGKLYFMINTGFFSQIGNETGWESIVAGEGDVCGIRSGEIYCSSTQDLVRIGNESNWERVATQEGLFDSYQSCGIRNGELYCWGTNSSTNDPVRIGADNDWTYVATGHYFICGIRSGELYCWGENYWGQLGDGTSGEDSNKSSPTRVGMNSGWTVVAAGQGYTCGILDSQLYCWGYTLGFGRSSISKTVVPQRIGSYSDWTFVAAGSEHACGIRSGQLYCWGDNYRGQLGIGTEEDHATPQRVGLESDWIMVTVSVEHTCGIRAGGKLYCWGNNISENINLSGDMYIKTPYQL